MRGLKQAIQESEDSLDEEEDRYEAIVEMPENNENSINIKINNKQLFPTS